MNFKELCEQVSEELEKSFMDMIIYGQGCVKITEDGFYQVNVMSANPTDLDTHVINLPSGWTSPDEEYLKLLNTIPNVNTSGGSISFPSHGYNDILPTPVIDYDNQTKLCCGEKPVKKVFNTFEYDFCEKCRKEVT